MAAPATTIAAALTPCRSSGRSSTGPGALAPFSAPPPCVSWNPQVKVPGPLKTPFVGPRTAFPVPARIRTPHGTRSGNSTTVRAAVSVGDKLPDATLSYLDKEDKVQTIRVSDLTRGKKVVLFAVPGAFTPTCSQKHLPGFIEKADELRAKGVQTIACISVNDAFVMKAWGEKLNAGDKVLLLADGNGEFTRALGFSLDLSDKPAGLGVRSRRYALLAEDGVVEVLNLEEGGAFTISGAEDILKVL